VRTARLLAAALAAATLAACASSTGAGTTRTTPKPEGPEPSGAVAPTTTARSSTTPVPAGSTDPAVETVTVQGTPIDVVVALPPGHVAGKAYPTVFTFPPGGQDRDLTLSIVKRTWAAEAAKRGWVVLSPAAPTTGLFYDGKSAALVPGLLDALTAEYPPAGGKVHLSGVSNGGLSAFRAVLDHPERFRSMVVWPGYPPESSDTAKLAGLKDVPVAMIVGGDDSGWRQSSEATRDALTKLGYKVSLDVRPGEGHIIESLTGAQLFDLFEKFAAT